MIEWFKGLGRQMGQLGTSSAWGVAPNEYVSLLKEYGSFAGRRVFKRKSIDEMKAEAAGRAPMKRHLGPVGLSCVGVGLMCGAGIFNAPGYIAKDYAGQAVCISYLIAAVSATLSCFCYAEFSVDLPLAGAAYNYLSNSLGEFMAWIVTSNLVFEYVLADAYVIRLFSSYLAVLCNQDTTFFQYEWIAPDKTPYIIDWWAFGVTLALTTLLSLGIKESATFNTWVTVAHIGVMIFIIIAGFVKAKPSNIRPFFPKGSNGWKGIFNGGAQAFFSFIGFDAVATSAEEVVNPSRTMPIGILSSMGIVTVIYFLMCITLTLMVPNADISYNATFAVAFQYVGLDWAKYIVAIGALMGILTSTLVGIYAPTRILTGCCREGLLPPCLAWVGPRGTPYISTWAIGIMVALISLFTGFVELANMACIGTFVVFWFVAVALLWKRSYVAGKSTKLQVASALIHIFATIGFSLGFVLVWTMPEYNCMLVDYVEVCGGSSGQQDAWVIAMGVLVCVTPCSMFFLCKPDYVPAEYQVPLYPWIPCFSIFVNTFLLGQLDVKSFERFGWWMVAVVVWYIVVGIFVAEHKDRTSALDSSIENTPKALEEGAAGDYPIKPTQA